jgi:hypothetical protein
MATFVRMLGRIRRIEPEITFGGRSRSERLRPKGAEEVLQVFVDNPGRQFADDAEIIAELRRRKSRLTDAHIIECRRWLFAHKHIKHHERGGPYRKRYLLNPDRPKKLAARPRRRCGKPTWKQLQELTQSGMPQSVVQLAAAMREGEDADFALHDALLENGSAALAEHFTDTIHKDCWALRCLTGHSSLAKLRVPTDDAVKWLGLSKVQFRSVAKRLGVSQAGRDLWRAAEIAQMADRPEVALLLKRT